MRTRGHYFLSIQLFMSKLVSSYKLSPNANLEIRQGDITREQVDAIVNAANSNLSHGGGVAMAISLAGGPIIQQESNTWIRRHGPVSHAKPAYTSGGRLPCRYVIHTVGPVWGSGNEEVKLSDAVHGSLVLADDLVCTSLAMPAISTGIFGFPHQLAAKIILDGVHKYFQAIKTSNITLVRIILYSDDNARLFTEEATRIIPGS
jgi:O-acetyl-ADP-ribose deacetylase (regulator of RNase III)